MSVTDIEEARRRRDEQAATVAAAANWILHSLPLALPWRDSAAFYSRWPGLGQNDLAAIDVWLRQRIVIQIVEPITAEQFDAATDGLAGRYEHWTRAANWLTRYYPERDTDDPEFARLFGDLTGAEFILATIERTRRLLRAAGQI